MWAACISLFSPFKFLQLSVWLVLKLFILTTLSEWCKPLEQLLENVLPEPRPCWPRLPESLTLISLLFDCCKANLFPWLLGPDWLLLTEADFDDDSYSSAENDLGVLPREIRLSFDPEKFARSRFFVKPVVAHLTFTLGLEYRDSVGLRLQGVQPPSSSTAIAGFASFWSYRCFFMTSQKSIG